MRGKLDEIAQLTQGQATIFNLQQLDQLEAVLAGRLEVGTRLIF
jgi:isopentenyl phosphate kinase